MIAIKKVNKPTYFVFENEQFLFATEDNDELLRFLGDEFDVDFTTGWSADEVTLKIRKVKECSNLQ